MRSEMHRRMLRNGYSARPVSLDCHFDFNMRIVTLFQTTLEFRPTLERQREGVANKRQVARQNVFDGRCFDSTRRRHDDFLGDGYATAAGLHSEA